MIPGKYERPQIMVVEKSFDVTGVFDRLFAMLAAPSPVVFRPRPVGKSRFSGYAPHRADTVRKAKRKAQRRARRVRRIHLHRAGRKVRWWRKCEAHLRELGF